MITRLGEIGICEFEEYCDPTNVLREWMMDVFKTRTVEDGNAYLQKVEEELSKFCNTGIAFLNDHEVGQAFYELGILEDKDLRKTYFDLFQTVCESL